MLTALRIGNFKAFMESQRIPIRPLTLIYGANSSGKSSILHSLILARHAIETGEMDVHRTNLGGDSVDLGGFHQYIFSRNPTNRLEWSVELDTATFSGRLAEFLAPVKQLTISITVGIALNDHGYPVIDSLPEIQSYEILDDKKSLLRMSKRPDGRLQLDRLDHEHPVFREAIKAMVMVSTTTETLHPKDYDGLDEAISDLVPEIVAKSTQFLPDGLVKSNVFVPSKQESFYPISKAKRKEELGAAIRSFLPRKIDEFIHGVSQAVNAELSKLAYLGPLRSYPPRHLTFSQYHDPNWRAGGGYAWDLVRNNRDVREKVNAWLMSEDRLQTPYEIQVREHIGMDQLDTSLEIGLEQLRYSDDPEINTRPITIEDSEAASRMVMDYIRAIGATKLEELVMVDQRNDTDVSHRDVGIGVSQVLPVLVSAFASDNKIVAIEQPEIHLHPGLQAELGDVFIESALGSNQNRFLIETHSEHLLLRIMRRMRQTNDNELPKGLLPITPKDVAVLFVQPKGPASVIRHLELDEEGQLLDPWPGGFFEEGYRERFF